MGAAQRKLAELRGFFEPGKKPVSEKTAQALLVRIRRQKERFVTNRHSCRARTTA